MIELRDLAIEAMADIKHIKDWVDKHDCEHKYLKKQIDEVRDRMLKWCGGLSVLVLALTFIANWFLRH